MDASRRGFLFGVAAVATAACRRSEGRSILVFAAASTHEALTELGSSFEAARRIEVRFSWGGSGDLARQIEAGAPADVFLSADEAKVDRLERAGLVASRRDLLRNKLVVVVPRTSTRTVATPQDLAGLGKIALGDPASVAAGAHAKAWLEAAGTWAAVAPKVVPTLDVRAALAAVDAGAVDAAVVFRTDASLARASRVAFEPADQPRIVYPVAVLARGKRDDAHAFVEHLASSAGRAVFDKLGFA
ncbi:MAG: molybdate ABC transporter substrate-binding protein [Deltaproteobacteria bacterium]|nr:molybdate ABC transporter substrate-binding protein [Deltaproteobacteria bacterium]